MKLLVFAHIPPPHHGQSYMVKLMLDGFGGDCRKAGASTGPVQCYHVNAQVSDNMEDIGTFRFGKLFLIFRYCLEAIWCRIRFGVRAFYYVPAPGKRAALYRDWIVMLLCRPFFRHRVYHWHASGLGDWLQKEGNWFERWLTHRLLGNSTVGLSLAIPSMRDALWFCSDRVEIVPNGIPDPCPDFDTRIRPRRIARVAARRKLKAGEPLTGADAADSELHVFRVFYLAHCTKDKGVFDTVDGIRLANAMLKKEGSPLRVRGVIAGAFLFPHEEAELKEAIARANESEPCVEYAGFVGGEMKQRLLEESDCMCFPTYYSAEGQPVSLLEAMAFGLQIVTTRWRAIPELLPPDYPGFVPAKSPEAVATALQAAMFQDARTLRDAFLSHFTIERHVEMLGKALKTMDSL